MGLNFIVPEKERLPQLNAISIPEGVDEAAVRGILLNDYQLETVQVWVRWLVRYGASA
jgi:alanine-glyoxylate transaminase/serine-glyoxylate transaminase/serine-pyruvate transaminase